MNIAQSFGDALKTLNIDTTNNPVPSNTMELLTNVFSNLTPNQAQNSPQQQSQNTNENEEIKPQAKKTKLTIFTILKISLLLTVSFIILSLDFTKNIISKLSSNPIMTYAILCFVFFMITFCSLKWWI